MTKPGYVYLMANRKGGDTYLGVTSNLPQRAYQHRTGMIAGHSKRKGCMHLIWFQEFPDIQDARAFEWKLKKWKRAWKVALVEETNPEWEDLFETLF